MATPALALKKPHPRARLQRWGVAIAAVLLALAIAGSILGFLPFNFNPARIFLGDSGSLFLGFVLALISRHGSAKGSTAVSIVVPVLALGLPIMDTLLSMIRRLMRSFLGDPAGAGSIRKSLRCIIRPDSSMRTPSCRRYRQ